MSELVQALEGLWRIPHPGPGNLFASPAFHAVSAACKQRHGNIGLSSALYNILRSVGVPFALTSDQRHLAGTPEQAAAAITRAFTQTSTNRRYLCALDLADTLPAMQFGPCRILDLTAAELSALLDAPRLTRFYPGHSIDLRRLAQFTWLVIDEEMAIDVRPEVRAMPFMFESWDRAFGGIDPYKGHFPQPVADALFFLLLGAWEDWASHGEIDWRGFHIPFVYTLDSDLSVRPQAPPDPDTLSWEPWIIDDEFEGEIELERPVVLQLDEAAAEESARLDETSWQTVHAARQASLFTTPVAHFLVQAFHVDGIDEFMAHITTIEAALGLQADFRVPKTDPFPRVNSSRRLQARIAALLNEKDAATRFKTLFDLRSQFVHGRTGVGWIGSDQRVEARRLARRVSAALVNLASRDLRPREEILAELLVAGMEMQTP